MTEKNMLERTNLRLLHSHILKLYIHNVCVYILGISCLVPEKEIEMFSNRRLKNGHVALK